jgi:hypothetical protein
MNEIQLAMRLPDAAQPGLTPWLNSLRVGQTLQARVLEQPAQGQLLLRIAGHDIAAASALSANRGAVLSLQVTALQPYPQMQVLASFAGGAGRVDPLHAQLTALLARQGSLLPPLKSLLNSAERVKLLSLLGGDAARIGAQLEQLATAQMPRDAKALREAFENSGFFLESSLLRALASGAGSLPVDIKSLLLRLLFMARRGVQPGQAAAVQEAPLENLRSGLEAAVAGLTLNQLRAQLWSQQGAIYWALDLPFRTQADLCTLGVVIRREEGAAQGEEEAEWKVWLQLVLPRLGAVGAEVFLRGARVSVVFYAKEQLALAAIDGALDALRATLEALAFEVAVLRVEQGEPDFPETSVGRPGADAGYGMQHVDERI